MLRPVLCAWALLITPATAQGISGAGPNDGPLTSATPEQIAEQFPRYWGLRDSVLASAVTRLGCPVNLGAVTLRGTRQSDTEAHCVWLDGEERFGVWALSATLDDREYWRERFQSTYEEGAHVPGNEVVLLQTVRVGDCIVDSYSIHRSGRFWSTIHEVWAPRMLHQIRNFTYDEVMRGRVDAMSERILTFSVASLCGAIS